MKRLIAMGFGVLALTACGGNSNVQKAQGTPSSGVVQQNGNPKASPQTNRQNVQVVKSGFSQHAPDSIGNSYISYAAVIFNPNPKDWFAEVSVTSTFSDDAGAVVSSQTDHANVLPNQTVAVAGGPQVKGATKMDVQAYVTNWTNVGNNVGAFTVQNPKYSSDQYTSKVTGAISSTFQKDLQNVRVTVVLEDANGNPNAGSYTNVDVVPAGGKTSFEVSSLSVPVNAPAKVEAWGEVTNLSLVAPTP